MMFRSTERRCPLFGEKTPSNTIICSTKRRETLSRGKTLKTRARNWNVNNLLNSALRHGDEDRELESQRSAQQSGAG